MTWDEGRIERLKEMWDAGASGSTIGEALGKSRNAIIGKAHRLGLARRVSGTSCLKRDRHRQKRRPSSRRRDQPLSVIEMLQDLRRRAEANRLSAIAADYAEAKALPDLVVPIEERRTLLDLEPGDCRWPMGDPKQPGFHFCNRLAWGSHTRALRGMSPYCEFHLKRAHVPTASPEVKAYLRIANAA